MYTYIIIYLSDRKTVSMIVIFVFIAIITYVKIYDTCSTFVLIYESKKIHYLCVKRLVFF